VFYLALDSRVSLVVSPSLSDLSAAPEGERDALLVTLEVHRRDGAGRTIESEFVRVPWRHVRLRAEICLAAYLDDIHLVSELHLLRPFSAILRELGPSVGLHFDSLEKNFIYVPRCFSADCTAAFPDAVIVSDLTPGAGPKEQMREGARALRGDPSKLLISHIGLPKLMGAPLRCLCPGPGLEGDIRWIRDRAHERAREVARLFAHLGLEAVDEEVGRLSPAEHQAQYDEYRLRAACFRSLTRRSRCSYLDTALVLGLIASHAAFRLILLPLLCLVLMISSWPPLLAARATAALTPFRRPFA